MYRRLSPEEQAIARGICLRLTEPDEAEAHADALNPLERQFLATSQAAAQRREAEREARRQRELEAAHRVAEAERQRAEEQARAASRLRWLAGALGVVFLLAVAVAVFAMNQQRMAQTMADNLAAEVVVRSTAQAQVVAAQETAVAEGDRAERQARLALSRQLAAQSLNHVDDQMDPALLLSLEAYRATDTVEARGSLLNALEHNPQLTTFLRGHTDTVCSVTFRPDGKTLASGGSNNTVIMWDLDLDSWRARACRIANRNLTRAEWKQFLGDEP